MAARRRRVLLVLVVAALMLLVGAALGPGWLSVPALALTVLVVAYVVQLRRHAALRAERDWHRPSLILSSGDADGDGLGGVSHAVQHRHGDCRLALLARKGAGARFCQLSRHAV